jgi:hypothetical protein
MKHTEYAFTGKESPGLINLAGAFFNQLTSPAASPKVSSFNSFNNSFRDDKLNDTFC